MNPITSIEGTPKFANRLYTSPTKTNVALQSLTNGHTYFGIYRKKKFPDTKPHEKPRWLLRRELRRPVFTEDHLPYAENITAISKSLLFYRNCTDQWGILWRSWPLPSTDVTLANRCLLLDGEERLFEHQSGKTIKSYNIMSPMRLFCPRFQCKSMIGYV